MIVSLLHVLTLKFICKLACFLRLSHNNVLVTLFCSSSRDNVLNIWDLSNKKVLRTIPAFEVCSLSHPDFHEIMEQIFTCLIRKLYPD